MNAVALGGSFAEARDGLEVAPANHARVEPTRSSWVIRYFGRIPYRDALERQEALVRRKIGGDACNYLLLLEHDPVYTIGRGGAEADLREAPRTFGLPVFRVSRGGGATFHGPGQLVVYPILELPRRDIRWYVEQLEAAAVAVCRRFRLEARGGRDGSSVGVWIGDRKIASIGIGIRRWVAFHGIALNVDVDLDYFRAIVPCRQPGLSVTSLASELGWRPRWESVACAFVEEFLRTMPGDESREDARDG